MKQYFFKNNYINGLIALRALLFFLFLLLVNHLFDLQVTTFLATISAIIGIFLGTTASFSRSKMLHLMLLGGLGVLLVWALPNITAVAAGSTRYWSLLPYSVAAYFQNHLTIFLMLWISTILFWRFRSWAFLEILTSIAALLALLSPHQDFHFNRPTLINSLAWSFGVTEVSVFLGLGTFSALAALFYLYLSSSPSRPVAPDPAPSKQIISGRRRVLSTLLAATCTLAVFLVGLFTVKNYFANSDSGKVSGGVGQAASEGEAPLGFHSALGTTSQPAALVRLEGDYKENPFSPMLYFRESALSELSGNEYVIASRRFDTDVSLTAPSSPYSVNADPDLKDREQIVQSVYLLSDQKLAFAIDYPQALTVLQNPDPGRFRGAYRAYSLAPTTPLSAEALAGFKVGDPRWDAETKAHYLKPHSDSRYASLAYQISADAHAISDIDKAFAIASYLSEITTYTLTPNHEVAAGEDPVAPYLFGDHRGYCVHFAHAMVHMFRALGIPARIGTGYLSDLSQSRDGHILLRMSDRHAWSEIYITSLGWVPFDIKPQKVESHGDTEVDMKLLEELMQKLEPGKEILPENLQDNETAFDRFRPSITPSQAGAIALLLLLLLYGAKLYLRHSWRLSKNTSVRAERGYRALASLLDDLGERRGPGETREEFRSRMKERYRSDVLPFATIANGIRYGGLNGEFSATEFQHIQSAIAATFFKKLLAFLSPRSIYTYLSRRAW